MSKYEIIQREKYDLFCSNSPIIIENGALVRNTEVDKLHIQLKFKNISDKNISMLKINVVAFDEFHREIETVEKKYVDLLAVKNQSFADQEPIFLNNRSTTSFKLEIVEIFFSDGTSWQPGKDIVWEKLPELQKLSEKFSQGAIEEFKIKYCQNAKNLPKRFNGGWFCACGALNKTSSNKCCNCGADLETMENATNEELETENQIRERNFRMDAIYFKAKDLVESWSVKNVEQGINLLISIKNWKDSVEIISFGKNRIIEIRNKINEKRKKEREQKEQEKKEKRRGLIFLTFFLGFFIAVCIATSCPNAAGCKGCVSCRGGEVEYGYKNYSVYGVVDVVEEAWTITVDGKKADRIFTKAFYNNDEIRVVRINKGIEYLEIDAFRDCSKLKKVFVPKSVMYMDNFAFFNCPKLTIYCEAESQPSGWENNWNGGCKVVWGHKG